MPTWNSRSSSCSHTRRARYWTRAFMQLEVTWLRNYGDLFGVLGRELKGLKGIRIQDHGCGIELTACLLEQSCRYHLPDKCPLLKEKRTSKIRDSRSAFDPETDIWGQTACRLLR